MNRPDIKDFFPEDARYMDVVKSALENPWYTYATQLDMFIDDLLEKKESSESDPLSRQNEFVSDYCEGYKDGWDEAIRLGAVNEKVNGGQRIDFLPKIKSKKED